MQAEENRILAAVFKTGLMLHKELGPGLFESVYETLLSHELAKEGFRVERQVEVPLVWDGIVFEKAFRADVVIDGLVILEVKATEQPHPVHARQLLTYLKLMRNDWAPL
jgi:GxxExxY protein